MGQNDDEQAIRDLVQNWMDATKKGDLETILGMMTDDVIFQTPGAAPFGKDAFAAASANMKDMKIKGTSDIQEIKILGDWAWMRNKLEIAFTPPGGAQVKKSGYTLTILRRENGKWRIVRDANLMT